MSLFFEDSMISIVFVVVRDRILVVIFNNTSNFRGLLTPVYNNPKYKYG